MRIAQAPIARDQGVPQVTDREHHLDPVLGRQPLDGIAAQVHARVDHPGAQRRVEVGQGGLRLDRPRAGEPLQDVGQPGRARLRVRDVQDRRSCRRPRQLHRGGIISSRTGSPRPRPPAARLLGFPPSGDPIAPESEVEAGAGAREVHFLRIRSTGASGSYESPPTPTFQLTRSHNFHAYFLRRSRRIQRPVADALRSRGITTPFPVQKLVIEDVLDGRDVLVQSPTGSGKTLAFGVPIVERIDANGPRPAALILAPTRELACQIVDELESLCHAEALKIAAVYGGVGIQPQIKRAAKAHVIVATPGRLEDLIQRRAIDLAERPHARPRRGRPDARHGLPAARRPDRRAAAAQAPDAVLLGHARGRRPARSPAEYTYKPRRHVHAPEPEDAAAIAHSLRVGRHRRAPSSTRCSSELKRARPRPDARLRPHQARRRPARQEARLAGRQGAGDARRQDPGPATEGARPLRARRPARRSSRPTSPLAASTSPRSPT